MAKVIPEKFLPDRRSTLPNSQYHQLGGDQFDHDSPEHHDEDAHELKMDETTSDVENAIN